ncbi:MAG TPA: methylamine utilization protein [Rheinheimera sp.]|uniref:Methylamine utilization protein n=1 Tax=Rheinheimera nanhaiensis E407-8 TaxID=562729 RepID=I1DXW9_9GAMM|nr:methylamine utilization protein [Rheinheimera nanhaiensis]GAB58897.1 hypothetical protein RNAN_1885 [Rheinheimera nanhaiensis E407-8]HEX5793589.1 methylamine utilization protein [Rheinheimera sp.]
MTQFYALLFSLLIILCGLSPRLAADTLNIKLVTQHNQPLADAVVELVSPAGTALPAGEPASVTQQGLMFHPFVSAVVRGSAVDFPNLDKTRHHVYSFSPAKTFEIELYSGKPEQPVIFDKAGIVALGCNIHDYMQAYIYVGDSPLLAVSNSQGELSFSAVAPGDYQLRLWHPWQLAPAAEQHLTLSGSQQLQFTLAIEHKTKPAAPKRGFGQ